MFRGRATHAEHTDEILSLKTHCEEVTERLQTSERRLRERGELLYELQKQYASEHFELQESLRNLRIERLRNAGLFADRDIILRRAEDLQSRIAELKGRLRRHEAVEDQFFDYTPIVAEKRSNANAPRPTNR